jgi:hypothetical protein
MLKVISVAIALLMTSGCCEVFGICTSVNVHTNISAPETFANADFNDQLVPAQAEGAQIMPASAISTSTYYLPPD